MKDSDYLIVNNQRISIPIATISENELLNFEFAEECGVSLVTGRPGSGKSTIIRLIIAGLVKNIIRKIKSELREEKVTVVATGGMSKIIKEEVSSIDFVDRTLTLNGLRLIYELNQKGERK